LQNNVYNFIGFGVNPELAALRFSSLFKYSLEVGYFDAVLLEKLGVSVDAHGKMPDAVLDYPEGWFLSGVG
jgi:hypothetical protein